MPIYKLLEILYLIVLVLSLLDNRNLWKKVSRINEINITKDRLLLVIALYPICLLFDSSYIKVLSTIITAYNIYKYYKVLYCQGYRIIINTKYKSNAYTTKEHDVITQYDSSILVYDNLIENVPYYCFNSILKQRTEELGYEPTYIYLGTTYLSNEEILNKQYATGNHNLQVE